MHSVVTRSIQRAQKGEFADKVQFKEWSELSVSPAGPAITIYYKKEFRYSGDLNNRPLMEIPSFQIFTYLLSDA